MLEEAVERGPVAINPIVYAEVSVRFDSIEAVDLGVKLQELTGRKLKVDEFKSVRTVGDVIDRVHAVLVE